MHFQSPGNGIFFLNLNCLETFIDAQKKYLNYYEFLNDSIYVVSIILDLDFTLGQGYGYILNSERVHISLSLLKSQIDNLNL